MDLERVERTRLSEFSETRRSRNYRNHIPLMRSVGENLSRSNCIHISSFVKGRLHFPAASRPWIKVVLPDIPFGLQVLDNHSLTLRYWDRLEVKAHDILQDTKKGGRLDPNKPSTDGTDAEDPYDVTNSELAN